MEHCCDGLRVCYHAPVGTIHGLTENTDTDLPLVANLQSAGSLRDITFQGLLQGCKQVTIGCDMASRPCEALSCKQLNNVATDST